MLHKSRAPFCKKYTRCFWAPRFARHLPSGKGRALLRRRFFVLGASLDKAALGILQSYACETGRNYAFGRLW